MQPHLWLVFSPYVREFLSMDNPKNAQQQDVDMQPGSEEADALVSIPYNTTCTPLGQVPQSPIRILHLNL